MARNEEGEFELILGNKQLLSVFFIVVVLLGVFFAMGYIMGRNSNPVVEARRESGPTDNPIAVTMTDKPSAASPGGASLVDAPPKTVEITPPPVEKKDPDPVIEKKIPERKVEEKKPEPKTEIATTKKPDEKKKTPDLPRDTEPASAAGQAPPTGTFLQVVAAKKPEAELISRVLVNKGYRAWITPVEKKDLFRVLVGPVKDPAQAKKFTEELKAQGFQPIQRKL